METTLFVLLDACKYNTLNEKYSPFLYKLCRKGIYKKSSPVPGFCQRTPMLTGLYPRTSGHLMKYKLDPANSPFRWTQNLSFLKIFENASPSLRGYIRYVIRAITKMLYRYNDPDPHYIPFNILALFDIVDNKYSIEKELIDLPNIFSICNQYGKKYICFFPTFPLSKSDMRMFKRFQKILKTKEHFDFFMMHLINLDCIGHKYSMESPDYRKMLLWLDHQLEKIYQLLSKNYDSVNMIIVSDHGMKNVIGSIDLLKILSTQTKVRLGKDYILFLDSTVGRIWILNKSISYEIIDVLSLIPHGHIVTTRETIRLKIGSSDRSFGDIFFWLDPGYVISPNFFEASKNPPKSMHGYLKKNDDLYGIFILKASAPVLNKPIYDGTISLVDVFPTVLTLLGVPIPKTCEGKSVIANVS